MKILSIIIPTYNMEKYLHRCVDSLIAVESILPYLEIIIVNDGSKDKSLNIAQDYQHKYPESIIVIDKKNGNYGSCINAALPIVHGKYIKVIDADDWVINSNLVKYLEKLKNTDADLIITDYTNVFENNQHQYLRSFKLDTDKFYNNDILTSISLKDFQMHSVTYRTEILRKLKYKQTEGISYTDQEWIFYPIQKVKRIIYFNLNLYQYLLGRTGQTMDTKVFAKQIPQQIFIVKKMIEWYNSQQVIPNSLDNYQSNYFFNRMSMLLSGIYKTILLLSQHPSLKDIRELDEYLQQKAPNLYKDLDNSYIHKSFPYKYIRKFHHTNNCPNTFIKSLYQLFIRLRTLGIFK